MMTQGLVESIRSQMEGKDNEELLRIWRENDLDQWSAETFEVVGQILTARGVALPQQASAKAPRPTPPLSWRLQRILGILGGTALLQMGIGLGVTASLAWLAEQPFVPVAAGCAFLVLVAYPAFFLAKYTSGWICDHTGYNAGKGPVSVWSVAAFLGGAAGWYSLRWTLPDWVMGLALLATLLGGLVFLVQSWPFRWGRCLFVQVAVAGVLCAAVYPVSVERFAIIRAIQRSAAFRPILADCSLLVNRAVLLSAVMSPKAAVGMPALEGSILVLAVTNDAEPYQVSPSPCEWYLPRHLVAADAEHVRVVVVIGPLGREAKAFAAGLQLPESMQRVVAPVEIIKWPEKTIIGLGKVSLNLPAAQLGSDEDPMLLSHQVHGSLAEGVLGFLQGSGNK